MSAQSSYASLCKNSFGNGAKINLVVGTTSSKKNEGENGAEKSETAAIILGLNDEEMIDADDTDLTEWLSKLHLHHIWKKLNGLGVTEIEDMTLLDEEDLNSLDLKKIEIKKLRRAIAKLEESD